MDISDKLLIEKLLTSNHELAKLYKEHKKLDADLAKLDRLVFKTAKEEQEIKRLKGLKLKGVESMMRIVASERDAHLNYC